MKFWPNTSKRVYLDWAAATPLLPEAKAAMLPYLEGIYANPSAIHKEGVESRRVVEEARSVVAKTLQVKPEYVTFTGSGTEANNLAILGTINSLRAAGKEMSNIEVITTKIEHLSVLETMKALEKQGVVVKYVGVDEEGKIILSHLRELITEKTVLISCTYVNSEIGVIQPLHAIRKVIAGMEENFASKIFLHVDAAQAPMWLSCQFDSVGADYLTLDAGKCRGPKGVGILVRSRRSNLTSHTYGGGQEAGLRPGTENVAGVVGAARALSWAQGNFKKRAEEVSEIRNEAITYINETFPEAVINGSLADRVANNINISVLGLDTEFAVVVLDKNGFAVSTKSACSGAGGGESKVVKEISNDSVRATSTIRLTVGPDSKLSDIKRLVDTLKNHARQMSSI